MTPSETVMLTRYVKACCPQQAIDEYTPDAWHDLLGDLSFADCKAAAAVVAQRQPFVAPAEIRAEVRRVRNDRLAREITPAPSPELADRPGRYKAELEANVHRIADARSLRKAIAPPNGSGEPPAEWLEARKAHGAALVRAAASLTPQEIARRHVAESRAARGAPAATEPGTGESA